MRKIDLTARPNHFVCLLNAFEQTIERTSIAYMYALPSSSSNILSEEKQQMFASLLVVCRQTNKNGC